MSFRLFRYAPLSVLLLSFSRAGMAEDYFDPAALELSSTEQKTADLHYFSEKGGQMPGTWLVTLEINGREERHQEITFVNEKGSLQPVFSVSLLEALGVNVRPFLHSPGCGRENRSRTSRILFRQREPPMISTSSVFFSACRRRR